MAKSNYAQYGFNAGELSPRMEMRDDVDARRLGMDFLSNWFIHLQGPIETARGLMYLSTSTGSYGRVFQFYVSTNVGFVVIVTSSTVKIFNESGEQDSFASVWTDAQIEIMQTKMAPGTLELFMVAKGKQPYSLTYNKGAGTWSFAAVTFTNTPVEWTGTNWPGVITFHEGRLYLGATPDQPEDFWATRPGSKVSNPPDAYDWARYRDFRLKGTGTDPEEVLPDHALQFTIERRGEIRWMMSSKNLVIGTENAEHIVTAQDGVIIPGDIQSTLQSTFGSIAAQAVDIGNDILFISVDGRKVRTIGFEWTREAWVSKDITFQAEHITGGGNILKEIHYAANPYSMILCVTALGTLVVCTYDAENKNGGFYRRTSKGSIYSLCTLPQDGTDEQWMILDRDGTGTNLYLEKVAEGDNIKLDSYVTLTSDPATTSWQAAHLAGKECQLLVDGAVHENVTLDGSGNFETDYAASEVIIGLQVLAEGSTMSLGTLVQYVGTARPMKKRWNKLYARLTASYKPLLNGVRPPIRHPATPMGEMEAPATETVQIANLGWDLDGRISIVQDLPIPTEVAGIFGELNQEQL